MEQLSFAVPDLITFESTDYLFDLQFSPVVPQFAVCSVNGSVYE